MWLKECYDLYPEITLQKTGKKYNLAQVEEEVKSVFNGTHVDARVLKIIENSTGWTYPEWWPRLSEGLVEPIKLRNLDGYDGKEHAVSVLYKKIKHLEVVSVVLRFICPREFGIFSPPVVALANIAPARTHVKSLQRYIGSLKKLLDKHPRMERVAAIDMALWSAAHLNDSSLINEARNRRLWKEISQDEFFQEIRLSNLFQGFGEYWNHTARERLVLARSLLRHDHSIAGVVAAKCFEDAVVLLGRSRKIDAVNDNEFSNYISELHRSKRAPVVDWIQCRELRNFATHATLSEKDIEKLIQASEVVYAQLLVNVQEQDCG